MPVDGAQRFQPEADRTDVVLPARADVGGVDEVAVLAIEADLDARMEGLAGAGARPPVEADVLLGAARSRS